jgi:hypothetical protein
VESVVEIGSDCDRSESIDVDWLVVDNGESTVDDDIIVAFVVSDDIIVGVGTRIGDDIVVIANIVNFVVAAVEDIVVGTVVVLVVAANVDIAFLV